MRLTLEMHDGRQEIKSASLRFMATVSLTLDIKRFHHIVIDELEVFVAEPVLHISLPACEEVVHDGHLVAIHHQLVGQVGSYKTSSTSDLMEEHDEESMYYINKLLITTIPVIFDQ